MIASPVYLGLLLLFPLYFMLIKQNGVSVRPDAFGVPSLTSYKGIAPSSKSLNVVRFHHFMVIFSFIALVIAAARPMSGKYFEQEQPGIDIFLALDMSSSMKAYDDTAENLDAMVAQGKIPDNRFRNATKVLSDFVRKRAERCSDKIKPRCDRIGFVIFGNGAYLAVPLTTDYDLLKHQIEERKISDINGDETAIADAILRCVAGLRSSDSPSKAVILLTDGEQKGGKFSASQAIESATAYGVKIFTILIGKSENAYFNVSEDPENMRFLAATMPVNPELLSKIALETDGAFFRTEDYASLKKSLHSILDDLEAGAVEIDFGTNRRDFSPDLLALIAIVLALWLSMRKIILPNYP